MTLDLDFSNIIAYPPSHHPGIVVLRLGSQAHEAVEAAIRRITALLSSESIAGKLWIVEEHQVRIHD